MSEHETDATRYDHAAPTLNDVYRELSEIEVVEADLDVKSAAIHLVSLEEAVNESMREAAAL